VYIVITDFYIKLKYIGGLRMKCHGDNKEKQGAHKHSPLKHMLHMALCCGLPIVIVGLLPLITRFSPSAGSVVAKITPFICPIMMISMLPMLFSTNKKRSCCDNTNQESNTKEIV
jgi:hypothetical protein